MDSNRYGRQDSHNIKDEQDGAIANTFEQLIQNKNNKKRASMMADRNGFGGIFAGLELRENVNTSCKPPANFNMGGNPLSNTHN